MSYYIERDRNPVSAVEHAAGLGLLGVSIPRTRYIGDLLDRGAKSPDFNTRVTAKWAKKQRSKFITYTGDVGRKIGTHAPPSAVHAYKAIPTRIRPAVGVIAGAGLLLRGRKDDYKIKPSVVQGW